MKNFLLFYARRTKSAEGFTLIELLVTIIIIGVLSAIALPSFLNQASKAKQAEAKQYLSAINKAQQAYYLENNEFVDSIAEIGKLGIGIRPETANYSYNLAPLGGGQGVVAIAEPQEQSSSIKGYLSAVALVYQAGASDPTTLSVVCESEGIGSNARLSASNIQFNLGSASSAGDVACGESTVAVK